MAVSVSDPKRSAASAFRFPEKAASLALGALFLLVSIGLHPLTAPDFLDHQISEGETARQVTFILIFGLAVVAGRIKRVLSPSILSQGVPLLLGWCLFSITWSATPEIAFRRFVLLFVLVMTISLCVAVLGPDRTLKTTATILIAILVGDWLALLISDYSVHLPSSENGALAGSWRGMHAHKNIAGSVMALTTLLLIFVPISRSRIVQLGFLCCAIAFLFFTHSKTSIGFLGISVSLGYAYHFGWSNAVFRILSVLCIPVIAGILMLLMPFYQNILSLVSDGSSLFTGRAEIWADMVSLFKVRPMLGFGYGSFWGVGEQSPMLKFYYSWTFLASHGHNGYLDVLVSVGLIGFVITIFTLVGLPLYRLLFRMEHGKNSTLLFAWIIFCLLHNLLETSLLAGDRVISLAHFLVVALIAGLARPASQTTA